MTPYDIDLGAYAQELDGWVKAILKGRAAAGQAGCADRRLRKLLKMFSEGNQEKRRQLLEVLLAFVHLAIEELPELLDRYVQAVPLHAADVGCQDAERFLRWLVRKVNLTAQQRDHVICQRARHAVEIKARRQRLAYLHFLECWSLAQQLLPSFADGEAARIVVNPILVWASFHTTALLETGLKPPTRIMFHAFQEQTRVSVPSKLDRRLLGQLVELGPITLEDWLQRGALADRELLIAFAQRWAAEGVVAFI